MVEVPKNILKAMRTVIGYSYTDERKHCEAEYGIYFKQDGSIINVDSGEQIKEKDFGLSKADNHIFFQIKEIDEFLDSVKI